MRAIGISLSHHNTRLLAAQWRKISFAFVRSSGSTLNFKRFGSGLDRAFPAHISDAKANGLLVSAYHYLVAPVDGNKAYTLDIQAEEFLSCIAKEHTNIPPMIDIEDRKLTPIMIKSFFDKLSSLADYLSYSSLSIMRSIYKEYTYPEYLKLRYLARYPYDLLPEAEAGLLIDSNYIRGLQTQPAPFKSDFWQVTGKGKFSKNSQNVTLEIFDGDKHALISKYPVSRVWVRESVPPTPPTPPTPPVPPVPPVPPALRKLGAHVLALTPDVFLLSTKASVVKLVNNYQIAGELRKANPAIKIIGRVWADNIPIPDMRISPEQAAHEWVERQKPIYLANPNIEYWEGANERSFNNENEARWYANFELSRTRLLAGIGRKSVVGNFSVGYPDVGVPYAQQGNWNYWDIFLSILGEVNALGGLLGLHEYSVHFLWNFTTQGNVSLDAPAVDLSNVGWLTLRYRMVLNRMKQKGISCPIVITELGLDKVPNLASNLPQGGWKAMSGYIASKGLNPEEFYAKQLLWYEKELMLNPEVIGATIFTVGSTNDWAEYDIANTSIVKRLLE